VADCLWFSLFIIWRKCESWRPNQSAYHCLSLGRAVVASWPRLGLLFVGQDCWKKGPFLFGKTVGKTVGKTHTGRVQAKLLSTTWDSQRLSSELGQAAASRQSRLLARVASNWQQIGRPRAKLWLLSFVSLALGKKSC